jgi:hypothetical protein
METYNALIKSVEVYREDHGIPTCTVHLEYDDGFSQGFGGYDLRHLPYQTFLFDMMDAVGATSLNKMVGMNCRIRKNDSMGYITSIGHIMKDQWFYPEGITDE